MSQGVYVLGGKCPGGICPWGKCPGGTCPGGLCPRTEQMMSKIRHLLQCLSLAYCADIHVFKVLRVVPLCSLYFTSVQCMCIHESVFPRVYNWNICIYM